MSDTQPTTAGIGDDLLSRLALSPTDAIQPEAQRRTELLADVVSAAWGSGGDFIDADQFLTKPTVLRRMASLLAGRVPAGVDRLVGREPHSLVLAAALSLETGLPLVIAREGDGVETKVLTMFGELHPGEQVLVVEGVTGTGASAQAAVRAIRQHGAGVTGVLIAVDRGTGALTLLEDMGLTVSTLFPDHELRACARRGVTP